MTRYIRLIPVEAEDTEEWYFVFFEKEVLKYCIDDLQILLQFGCINSFLL